MQEIVKWKSVFRRWTQNCRTNQIDTVQYPHGR